MRKWNYKTFKIAFLLVGSLLIMTLVGCQSETEDSNDNDQNEEDSTTELPSSG